MNKNPLDARIIEYLKTAVIGNSPIPLDEPCLVSLLNNIRLNEGSTAMQYSLPSDIDIKSEEYDNLHSHEEKCLSSYLHLRRIIKNFETAYVANRFEKSGKKIQEAIDVWHITGFSSSTFCRHMRENAKMKKIMAKSHEMGYDYSIMGLYGRTFFEAENRTITLKRPFLAIPGISEAEDLKIIHAYESQWQKPSNNEALKKARSRGYDIVLKKLEEVFEAE